VCASLTHRCAPLQSALSCRANFLAAASSKPSAADAHASDSHSIKHTPLTGISIASHGTHYDSALETVTTVKQQQIHFRITEREYALIKKLAEERDLSIAQFLRSLIRTEIHGLRSREIAGTALVPSILHRVEGA